MPSSPLASSYDPHEPKVLPGSRSLDNISVTIKFQTDWPLSSQPSSSKTSTRRPSWTPSIQEAHVSDSGTNDGVSSPEDRGNFHESLQIDMKGLVGDAVGNMSISPASRDIVLAARRGLFIIDLEAPLEIPRFLPQGGTWDVADVQWNPHTSRAQYIVSTSSEKLLIWNLMATGKSNIEHILYAHYRAITDINWHTTEFDTVVSTGIDGWVWAWDLREPRKPIFAPGTQVKWSRQDANILASSHSNDVLIWDRRKGSLPISKIPAHTSKIYGIDWSHQESNEIVTCSLDKTIKIWDVNAYQEPKTVIHTTYPVWRARNLPFGHGVMSLAQRGEAILEMYARDDTTMPVDVFEGHQDVVKEFVWRRGGKDDSDIQLITWSKDRTLRFWPVDPESLQKVGHSPPISRGRKAASDERRTFSFRNPPQASKNSPLLSAPVGHRSILAEPVTVSYNKMTRGNAGSKFVTARVDALTWLSSVKVGEKRRGSSSGPGSGHNSAEAIKDGFQITRQLGTGRHCSKRQITSALTKLAAWKVTLEKHDLTKKRTCTLGLYGPWGESSTVFMRVTFTFPRDYPQATHPDGTPTVNLEQSPLISIKNRAFILRRLKAIRETRRPCLEACLRFLLCANEEENGRTEARNHMDSGSSDDDDDEKKGKDFALALRNHKNLAEPCTSQGTFGPNGEFVCFFRAPPRIVRNVLRGSRSDSPTKPSTPQNSSSTVNIYQSPSLVADAVGRLAAIASDRSGKNVFGIILTRGHRGKGPDHRVIPVADAVRSPSGRYRISPGATRRNAVVAREYRRFDHERIFITLGALFHVEGPVQDTDWIVKSSPLIWQVIRRLYVSLVMACGRLTAELSRQKDVQMLAMMSMIVLQAFDTRESLESTMRSPDPKSVNATPLRSGHSDGFDYFSMARSRSDRDSLKSPVWPRLPSASPNILNAVPSISSSSSSRGSWSSLFNTGTMRQLMSGVQDSIKDGLATPTMEIRPPLVTSGSIPIPPSRSDRVRHGPDSPKPSHSKGPAERPGSVKVLEREGDANVGRRVVGGTGKRIIVEEPPEEERHVLSITHVHHRRRLIFRTCSPAPLFKRSEIQQFLNYRLYHKRLELLKAVHGRAMSCDIGQHEIDVRFSDCQGDIPHGDRRVHFVQPSGSDAFMLRLPSSCQSSRYRQATYMSLFEDYIVLSKRQQNRGNTLG
ncbi:vacuolar membrane protein [Armillaria mellea]|nr:vacuolar membrane protein [Armillaria mellea]